MEYPRHQRNPRSIGSGRYVPVVQKRSPLGIKYTNTHSGPGDGTGTTLVAVLDAATLDKIGAMKQHEHMALSARVPRILLVEDSEDDAYFFHRLVRKSGLRVETVHVTNGLEAVERLKGARRGRDSTYCPDLILLDLKMPDFDGFDVLSWVQASSFAPPLNIAVLSGSDDESDIRRAMEMGAMAFFAKPMEIRDLIAVLERCGLLATSTENLSP